LLGGRMIDVMQIVHEFRKLNETLERIEEQGKESNQHLASIEQKVNEIAFEVSRIAEDTMEMSSVLSTTVRDTLIEIAQCVESSRDASSRSLVEIECKLQEIIVNNESNSYKNRRELEWLNETLSSIDKGIELLKKIESSGSDNKD
jgi:hypothetical protein